PRVRAEPRRGARLLRGNAAGTERVAGKLPKGLGLAYSGGTMPTHEVLNQPPPLEGYNLFATDCALAEGLRREGAAWAEERVRTLGELAGGEALRWGVQANANPPVLRTHDRYGHRLDEVEFHPAWHELLRLAVGHALHALPWCDPRPRAPVARAALLFVLGQAGAGPGRRVRADRPQVVLLGADVRRLPRPRAGGARALVLPPAALPPRRDAESLPHPAPEGQARQPLQRLERGRVRPRLGADGGRGGARRADHHRDGEPHPPRLRDRLGVRDAPGGRAGDPPLRPPRRLRAA